MAEKKKKRCFLVDYENVHKGGLYGIENLHKKDTVVIFYSQNADSLTFEVMQLLEKSKASVSYIKVDTLGQNALDFQLSSYTGYVLGGHPGCRCYIVSNDRGYANVQRFWAKWGEKIMLLPCIGKFKCSVKRTDVEQAVNAIEGLSVEDKQKAAEVAWKHLKTGSPDVAGTKVAINNDLMQYFGSDKTKVIYGVIRPLIK